MSGADKYTEEKKYSYSELRRKIRTRDATIERLKSRLRERAHVVVDDTPEPLPSGDCPHCGGPGWITTIGVRYGRGHDRPGQITTHRDQFRVPCCLDLASQRPDL